MDFWIDMIVTAILGIVWCLVYYGLAYKKARAKLHDQLEALSEEERQNQVKALKLKHIQDAGKVIFLVGAIVCLPLVLISFLLGSCMAMFGLG